MWNTEYLFREQYYDTFWKPCTEDGKSLSLGYFVINIEAMMRDIAEGRLMPHTIMQSSVKVSAKWTGAEKCPPEEYREADLSQPVIRVEIAPDSYVTAVGYRQLARALAEGIEALPTMFIAAEDTIRYFTEEKYYRSWVEYWNSKVVSYRKGAPDPETRFTPLRNRMLSMNMIERNLHKAFESTQCVEIREETDEGSWFALSYDPYRNVFELSEASHYPSVRCKNGEKLNREKLRKAVYSYTEYGSDKDTAQEIRGRIGTYARMYMAIVRVFSQWPYGQKRIDPAKIAEALEERMDDWFCVLDLNSGNVLTLPSADNDYVDWEDDDPDPEELESSLEYVSLPEQYELRELDWMRQFAEEVNDQGLMNATYGRGLYRRFRNLLDRKGLTMDWYAYREKAYVEFSENWCKENGIPYREIPCGRASGTDI